MKHRSLWNTSHCESAHNLPYKQKTKQKSILYSPKYTSTHPIYYCAYKYNFRFIRWYHSTVGLAESHIQLRALSRDYFDTQAVAVSLGHPAKRTLCTVITNRNIYRCLLYLLLTTESTSQFLHHFHANTNRLKVNTRKVPSPCYTLLPTDSHHESVKKA